MSTTKKKRAKPRYPFEAGDIVKGKVMTGRGSTIEGLKTSTGLYLVLSYERDRYAKRRVLVLRPLIEGSIEDKDVLYVGYTSADKFEGKKVGEAWAVMELPSHDVVVWAWGGVLYTYFDAVDAAAVRDAINESID